MTFIVSVFSKMPHFIKIHEYLPICAESWNNFLCLVFFKKCFPFLDHDLRQCIHKECGLGAEYLPQTLSMEKIVCIWKSENKNSKWLYALNNFLIQCSEKRNPRTWMLCLTQEHKSIISQRKRAGIDLNTVRNLR